MTSSILNETLKRMVTEEELFIQSPECLFPPSGTLFSPPEISSPEVTDNGYRLGPARRELNISVLLEKLELLEKKVNRLDNEMILLLKLEASKASK